jgi:hypothetical protein
MEIKGSASTVRPRTMRRKAAFKARPARVRDLA